MDIDVTTVGGITAIAGIVLSLLFSYVPGLNTWYYKQDKQAQGLVMAGILFLVVASLYGLGCSNLIGGFSCGFPSIWKLLGLFIQSLVANQVTYAITPDSPAKPK